MVGGSAPKGVAQRFPFSGVLATVWDNRRAINQHAAAAKVLSALLDKLRSASARGRRGALGVVRDMTGKKTATDLHSH
jgi:hypothetical protein